MLNANTDTPVSRFLYVLKIRTGSDVSIMVHFIGSVDYYVPAYYWNSAKTDDAVETVSS